MSSAIPLSYSIPLLYHLAQNTSLIVLSILLLPFSVTILLLSYARIHLRHLLGSPSHRPYHPNRGIPRKTILVTGVSMTKGLTLLRLLSKYSPYRIVGADTDPLACGRVSRFADGFRLLAAPKSSTIDEDTEHSDPYTISLLRTIARENVTLWLSCSAASTAILDARTRDILCSSPAGNPTGCRTIQFSAAATAVLDDKAAFIDLVRDDCGLRTPYTRTVRSADEVLSALDAVQQPSENNQMQHQTQSQQYLLKPTSAHRSTTPLLLSPPLPPQTLSLLATLPLSPRSPPYILQQFIRGHEYATHALIVRGAVRAFLAVPSCELLMHYAPLAPSSELWAAMRAFTARVAAVLQEREQKGGFTGHLSFDFLVRGGGGDDGERSRGDDVLELYPIECNPRAHTAVVLLRDSAEAARAYLDVLDDDRVQADMDDAAALASAKPTYWLPHDVLTLLLLPLLALRLGALLRGVWELGLHLLCWREGAFDVEDPLPALWLYHVYWPARFAEALWTGRRWGRVNVSTGAMFGVE